MEITVKTITFLFIIGLIFSPALLIRFVKKSNLNNIFISYFTIGLIVSCITILIFAWWNQEANILLLKHYNGYIFNPDSNGYEVDYEKVTPENIERVKKLERKYMGVGWPLKAIFLFVIYIPYLVLVYYLNRLLVAIIKRKKTNTI